jgi:putative transcriptional regulator
MYHYTECGLRNIWLANGYHVHKTPYGKGMSIEHVESLQRAIAQSLVRKAARLTGAEFRFLRKEQDLSQKSLAGLIGCTVSRSTDGKMVK